MRKVFKSVFKFVKPQIRQILVDLKSNNRVCACWNYLKLLIDPKTEITKGRFFPLFEINSKNIFYRGPVCAELERN